MEFYQFLILVAVLAYFLFRTLRLASINQRFAVVELGSFRKLKGPGVLFKFPSDAVKWYRLSTGDKGELIAPGLARFGEAEVPVKADDAIDVGSIVRIAGFDESSAIIMYNPDQRKTVTCEKCGHEMNI